MLKSEIKIFDGRPLVLSIVSDFSSRTIKTVIVLNNTPYFLYVGRAQDAGRENCLFVVEPYTNVTMPLNVAQNLYVTEGPCIGVIPPNLQASILYGEDLYPMSIVHLSRNVVIPLLSGSVSGVGNVKMTAQGLGAPLGSQPPGPFAVPASARRRTIYAKSGGGIINAVVLNGSFDDRLYTTVAGVSSGGTDAVLDIGTLALPPYLRLAIILQDPAQSTHVDAWMVVDL